MAKKSKKNENLSLEEKLDQALIPDWDEPYKLPTNWCWINLKSVLKHQSGNSKLIKGRLSSEKTDGLYDAYSASGQDVYIDTYEHEGNAIIVSAVGARCGKAFLASGKWSAIANTHIIYSNDKLFDIRYLYYILNNEEWWVKSGSAQPFVVVNESLSRPFALPPFHEQKRIVACVEDIFFKLDEAKEKAQEVIDGFENRKAAILHKAFSGELTAKWRRENSTLGSCYEKKRFDEVATIKSNLVDPSDYQSYPHIAPDNIEKKTGVLLEYRTIAEDNVKSGKHRFYPGQILYSKIRPNLSKVVVVDFDGLCSADMYPIEALGDTRCLWYFMLSNSFLEQASSAGSRSVLPKINQKELSALTVTIPETIDEQKELVRVIDSLLDKEYRIKQNAETVVEHIETMKKAILARAFRGELGTNDPTEESAIELIKKHIEETIKEVPSRVNKSKLEKIEVSVVAKTIIEALRNVDKLTPERLKAETQLDIDDFYEQLKALIDSGKIKETRVDGESYLEAVK